MERCVLKLPISDGSATKTYVIPAHLTRCSGFGYAGGVARVPLAENQLRTGTSGQGGLEVPILAHNFMRKRHKLICNDPGIIYMRGISNPTNTKVRPTTGS